MKIENSNMLPLSAKPAEAANPIEKKDDPAEVVSSRAKQDSVEMSENARLLAKSRTALGSVQDENAAQIETLKNQIASGDYTVQAMQIARRLLSTLRPK
jgi:flagellar biosynthesis anti-sigma factor FlgM